MEATRCYSWGVYPMSGGSASRGSLSATGDLFTGGLSTAGSAFRSGRGGLSNQPRRQNDWQKLVKTGPSLAVGNKKQTETFGYKLINWDAVHKAEKAAFVLHWNCFMMTPHRGQIVAVMRMGAPLFLIPLFLKMSVPVPIKDEGCCVTYNMYQHCGIVAILVQIAQVGGVWSGGVLQISGGFLQIFLGGGGVPPTFWGGFLQIFGGRGVPPNFWGVGGSSNFSGGGGSSKFSGGFFQIFGGGGLHRNTVNVRPVRILLECILVRFVTDNYWTIF